MTRSSGVRMSSAPYARRRARRSSDIDSGIVRMRRYPFTAQTSARPMPVLPLVGSTMVLSPGRICGGLGGLDHRQRDPVLHGAARVELLALAPELGAVLPGNADELDHRRPADELGQP